MKIRSSALITLALAAVVVAVGLVMTFVGGGIRFYSQSAQMTQLDQMFWCMLAVVVLMFIFGFVRYDLPSGLALGTAALHDQLVTLAVTAIASRAFAQSYVMPALVVASAVFTCAFTIPVIREARLIGRGLSLREHTRDEVADMAVKKTRPVLLRVLVAALLIFIAFAISGGGLMFGFALPLLAGILAAGLSAWRVSPYVWAAAASRSKTRR
ncbi:MAG: hypothetical protein GX540_03705 [Clostridiales bacterium]|nr:hypothetical protein [Clostridiales bacterium]